MNKESREALERRCHDFLLYDDNKKARSVVLAASEFADFVESEIARDRKERTS